MKTRLFQGRLKKGGQNSSNNAHYSTSASPIFEIKLSLYILCFTSQFIIDSLFPLCYCLLYQNIPGILSHFIYKLSSGLYIELDCSNECSSRLWIKEKGIWHAWCISSQCLDMVFQSNLSFPEQKQISLSNCLHFKIE